VEVRGEGRVHVPSVLGGAEDLLGEGDVILTDEEGSSGGCQAVQGGAGDGGRCGAGVCSSGDFQNERWVPGEDY
jgi:hypothetical protein